jgi:hypothetical protein
MEPRVRSHGDRMEPPSRSLLAAVAALLAACGGTTSATSGADGGAEGASPGAIGASCTPLREQSPTFAGFVAGEVNIEDHSPACGGGICLVNHFQGLTTCPYGQDAAGKPPQGAPPCVTPVTGQPVAPSPPAPVQAQCVDRRPSSAVYCSCRCANADGRTDDGATYCSCPGSFTCTQLVSAVVPNDPIAGAYCVEDNTEYDRNASCSQLCDPAAQDCP